MEIKIFITLLASVFLGSFTWAQSSGATSTGTTLTGAISTGTTLTGTISSLAKWGINKNYSKIRGSWSSIHEDFGYVNRYLQRPLTGAALIGAKAIIKQKNNEIKAINKEIKSAVAGSGVINWTGLFTKYETIYRSFGTAIMQYIDPAKRDAFTRLLEAKIAAVKKNLGLKKKNIVAKEQKYIKTQELKKKQAEIKAKQQAAAKAKQQAKEKQSTTKKRK